MAARGILVALALSALLPAVAAAQGHPTPTPDVVKQLRRHHHHGDWWRITTDSAHYEARVSVIDADGLAGVTTAHKAPPAPERIGWDSIVRLDLKKSHETRGKINGMLLGLCAGFIPLANGNANSSQPGYYMLAGAGAGYYLGGRMGAGNVHERPLYVAPTPLLSPVVAVRAVATEAAATDTAAAKAPSAPPTATPPAVTTPRASSGAGAASPEIVKACGRISPESLLRIDGDFGRFCGYASSIGPEGLGGLRVEPTRTSVQSPGSLTWDRISRIEVNGTNAGRGAVNGAIGMGALTGLLAYPLADILAGNGNDGGAGVAGIMLACAGVGAGVGLLIGGIAGATTSSWYTVYHR